MEKRRECNVDRYTGTAGQMGAAAADDGLFTSRREFLAGAGALAVSGATFCGLSKATGAQDPAGAESTQDPLRIIGEMKSRGGKLRGVLTVLNEEREMPPDSGMPPRKMMLRYFQGKDADGKKVWPPENADSPLPAPTLRARVGDQVELTLLNRINTGEFGATGMDRAEKGVDRGCDTLDAPDPQNPQSPGQELYPKEVGDEAPNCFHASSTVNIHFHGTHVTPDGLGDNVLLQLRPNLQVTEESVRDDFEKIFSAGPPGRWRDLPDTWRKRQEDLLREYDQAEQLPEELQLWPKTEERIKKGLWPIYQIGAYPYCFKLTEYLEDAQGRPSQYQMGQCPGTHWYHAHKHGSTTINLLNGMAGVFVIEGDYDDALEKFNPGLKKTQKVLIVQDFSDRPNLAAGRFAQGPPSLRVNGQLDPTITMQPGEIQLWRMVNASVRAVTTFSHFSMIEGTAPQIRQIAQDGVQFRYENYKEQPLLRDTVTSNPPRNTFAPANRIDILVQAPKKEGKYDFTLTETNNGGDFLRKLLTLQVAGDEVSMEFPSETDYPAFPKFLKDIEESEIRRHRTLNFGWEPKRQFASPIGNEAPQFTINDKQFSGDRYDQEIDLGNVEEWKLTNSTAGIAHPFHIHVNPFQVIEIYDPTSPDNKLYKPTKNWIWRDVIAIPPSILDSNGNVARDEDLGYVKIRHRFVDFPGSFVLHCHMLTHEDRGMMQLVRVKAEGEGEATIIPHH